MQQLEAEGAEIYWPYRDTDQSDRRGWAICARNRSAILDASEIHVWWSSRRKRWFDFLFRFGIFRFFFGSPKSDVSIGSMLDLGMVFSLLGIGWMKKVVIANPEAVKSTPHKSFENVLLRLQEETAKLIAMHEDIRKSAKHPSEL